MADGDGNPPVETVQQSTVEKSKSKNPWKAVQAKLKETVNVQSYETWLKPTRPRARENGSIHVLVPTQDFADTITEKWGALIDQTLREIGEPGQVVFDLPAPHVGAGLP